MARNSPERFRAGDLVGLVGGTLLRADADLTLNRLASLEHAQPGDLSFLAAARHRRSAAATRASLIIVSAALADALPATAAGLVVDDPYACYAAVSRWLAARARPAVTGPAIHPSACVDPQAQVDASARIGPGCVIGAFSVIGARVSLGAHTVIGESACIGDDSVLHPRVVVYPDCSVGERCIIHAGTVIGADGFGFAHEGGRWSKIAQLGRVSIGDDVEIGANCAIDRGALEDTVIGNGCKLDNLIQVGHNVRIGEHTAIAGCVGIAGSAIIGRGCMIGGGAGILGHLTVCDGAVISAMSLVTRSISEPGLHTGVFPLMPNADWEQAAVALKRLPALRDRVRQLEQSLSESTETPGSPGASGPDPKESP
jgi:UDP-3-O-[3-hydroxymyristoyl] glucosamine N-acyltransferase